MKVSVLVAMAALGISVAGASCGGGSGGDGGSGGSGGKGGSGAGGKGTGGTTGGMTGTTGGMTGTGGTGAVGSDKPFPTEELVLRLKFDEGEGTKVNDSSGKNNHATLVKGPVRNAPVNPTPTWSEGKKGKAYEFKGMQDWARVETSDSINKIAESDATIGMALGAWVKFTAAESGDATSNGFAFVIQRQLGSEGNEWFGLGLQNGKPMVTVSFHFTAAPAAVALDTWTHILMNYNEGTLQLYVNGELQGSKVPAFTIGNDDTPLTIGSGENSGGVVKEFVKAHVDDLFLFSRPLTDDEIPVVMAGN